MESGETRSRPITPPEVATPGVLPSPPPVWSAVREKIPGRLRNIFRALRHRDFRLFWSGQLVSLIGTWMQSAAQWWLIHRLAPEPIWLGLAGTASFLPVFLFSFLGGVVADRVSKRALLVGTQAASMVLALALAILTVTGTVQVYQILVLAFLLGTVNALDMPTRQAFMMELVGGEDLLNAVALNSTIFNAARVIGPMIAGFVIATHGEAICFFVNGASYLPVIFSLLLIRAHPAARPSGRKIREEIAEGFQFVIRSPRIRSLLLAVATLSIFGMSVTVLLPVFASSVLNRGARGYGMLMGAVGLGAVLGGLNLAGRSGTRRPMRFVLAGMTGYGIVLVAFSLSRIFVLSQALLFLGGLAMVSQLATTNSTLQRATPDGIRGRVLSVYTFSLVGMAPIGSFLAGFLAQQIGVGWTVRICGVVILFGAGLLALHERRSAAGAIVGGYGR